MSATLITIEGSRTVELTYPQWALLPGGYDRDRSRRYHEAPIAEGVYIVAQPRAADVHEIGLRYVPGRGTGGAWDTQIEDMVAMQGERVSLIWGDTPQPGHYMLVSVRESVRESVYGLDSGDIAGGWAPREMDVRLTLLGGDHAEIEPVESDDATTGNGGLGS